MQAEQKESMNINNEQMGAISHQLQQSEDRINHKARCKCFADQWEIQCCGETEGQDDINWGRRHISSEFEQQSTFKQMAFVLSDLVDNRNKEFKIPAMDTSSIISLNLTLTSTTPVRQKYITN